MMHVVLAALALGSTVGARPGSNGGQTPIPPFAASVHGVTASELGASWHLGCPVGPAALRRVRIAFWSFDGHAHPGSLVVARTVVRDVETIFRKLYDARFPLRRVQPISAFGGSDPRSLAADNTSGFNCRRAVAAGPPRWSAHAFGEAIDVNPVENPYLEGGRVRPRAGARFVDRSRVRPGMAIDGGTLVRAFAAVGWRWGGRWSATPDWQHFSASGG